MTTLVETIINTAMKADIRIGQEHFSHDMEEAMRALKTITGVPVGYKIRRAIKFGGIVEVIDAKHYKFTNCQKVSFGQMYPYILRNVYGNLPIGGYCIKDLVDGLLEARRTTKNDGWLTKNDSLYGNTSVKIKVLLNLLFTFITRSELVWADEVTQGVPAHGRLLSSKLFDKLYDIDDVYPVRIHTDEILVTSLNGKVDLSHIEMGDYPIYVDELDSYRTGAKDLVILDRIRYIVGDGRCFKTMHKMEEKNGFLTRRTVELQKRVWERV